MPVASKDTAVAATSPVIEKSLAVSSAVAVSALPVKSPVTLPVTLPSRLATNVEAEPLAKTPASSSTPCSSLNLSADSSQYIATLEAELPSCLCITRPRSFVVAEVGAALSTVPISMSVSSMTTVSPSILN